MSYPFFKKVSGGKAFLTGNCLQPWVGYYLAELADVRGGKPINSKG